MEHTDFLILSRAYEILSLLGMVFPELSAATLYSDLDVEEVVRSETLIYRANLPKGYQLFVSEEYRYRDYRLEILYYYSLLDLRGNEVISYDNSPHYPDLANFPHHKHFHPKDRYSPLSFSGELIDALKEIRWTIERAS